MEKEWILLRGQAVAPIHGQVYREGSALLMARALDQVRNPSRAPKSNGTACPLAQSKQRSLCIVAQVKAICAKQCGPALDLHRHVGKKRVRAQKEMWVGAGIKETKRDQKLPGATATLLTTDHERPLIYPTSFCLGRRHRAVVPQAGRGHCGAGHGAHGPLDAGGGRGETRMDEGLPATGPQRRAL
ncbi:hypothetical protein SKAU_G00215550 [Synaphobranchus kaupii]|uniref:Uncharacterized protein n=1 Tax=Synaphobranchus kaupii TaxID=118154 RepID=A0A9Q1IVH2_SYNKA|nr:hypothetical protein SKAU_G00215550 [Synaphobranchus kaupii]